MATTKVVDLIARAQTILQDTTDTRWPRPELLDWFNDAQKEVVLHRPDAKTVNAPFKCAAGKSKQSIPAEGLRLVDVIQNLENVVTDVDGNVTGYDEGNAVTLTERRILDEQRRGWHKDETTNHDARHFIYDERDPKSFYLYPRPNPSSGDHWVELVYSTAPTEIVIADTDFDTDTQVISLDDIYANALLDYMLYRAYSKDADYTANAQRALNHAQAFANSLGIKWKVDQLMAPDTSDAAK